MTTEQLKRLEAIVAEARRIEADIQVCESCLGDPIGWFAKFGPLPEPSKPIMLDGLRYRIAVARAKLAAMKMPGEEPEKADDGEPEKRYDVGHHNSGSYARIIRGHVYLFFSNGASRRIEWEPRQLLDGEFGWREVPEKEWPQRWPWSDKAK